MKVFDYEDIRLLPRRGLVKSRTECDTSVTLGTHTFALPLVPANMKSVIDESLAVSLAQQNYFYIMHRFEIDVLAFIRRMQKEHLYTSISVGVKPRDYNLVEEMARHDLSPTFLTIDIAHGHSNAMQKMLAHVRKHLGTKTFVIAGNVATPEGVSDLERWGADATKIGVGPGRVCITSLKTGFGTGGWQLSAVNMCRKVATKPLIADGGLRSYGDIAKAVRFGACFAMSGSLFAGHIESPSKTFVHGTKKFKEYYGSASLRNKHVNHRIEGKQELVPLKGSIFSTLKDVKQSLQSAISYAGGNSLSALKQVRYVLLNNTEGY